MTDTVIAVRGSHRIRRLAEQASVSASARHEGPKRDAVLAATSATAERLQASIAPHAASGAVSTWSTDRVAIRVDRPWNDGKPTAPVYSATVGIRAVFTDVEALGRWLEEIAPIDGVELSGPSWDLSEATRDALLTEARAGAVRDATARAGVYATAAGLGTVRVTAIADPGLLGDEPGGPGGGSAPKMFLAARAEPVGPSFTLAPEEIEVVAEIEARFTAS